MCLHWSLFCKLPSATYSHLVFYTYPLPFRSALLSVYPLPIAYPLIFMLLTFSQFHALAELDQDHYVQDHGQLIAHRWHENYSIELYAMGSFYCERWLEQECRHLPTYQAFATDACLAPYRSFMEAVGSAR